MQKLLKFVVAGVIVLAILAFMTTYSVRFTEKAVVTTFGKASAESIRENPGMGFRWPYPIQNVIKYDTRKQVVEALPQTVATRDESQLIVSAFVTWRVTDPLKFYQLYGRGSRPIDHVREASDTLRGSLSSALSAVSQYRLDELLSIEPGASKLGELEAKIKERLLSREAAGGSGKALAEGGIEVVTVAIANIQMPEAITQSVFDSMKARRTRIAAASVETGKAEAQAIRSSAESDAAIIMDFVKQRADTIRSQGDQEAAQYYAMMKEDSELAVFLRSLDIMRAGLGKTTTVVMPMSAPGMSVFNPNLALDKNLQGVPTLFPQQSAGESGKTSGGNKGGN